MQFWQILFKLQNRPPPSFNHILYNVQRFERLFTVTVCIQILQIELNAMYFWQCFVICRTGSLWRKSTNASVDALGPYHHISWVRLFAKLYCVVVWRGLAQFKCSWVAIDCIESQRATSSYKNLRSHCSHSVKGFSKGADKILDVAGAHWYNLIF